jgi:tRNA(fMet)-specific endonuclease VapC
MTRRMLDTNTIGYLMRSDPRIARRISDTPSAELCASAVTEGEVRFGLSKRKVSPAMEAAINAFFTSIHVAPWTRSTATIYGKFRADLQRQGRPLAPLDMMIAAHALELGAVLVTSDRAILSTPGLASEDWLAP